MLPVLPSLRRLGAWILGLILLVSLGACSNLGQPPRKVLLQARDLQVQLPHAELASALALPAPEGKPSLNRVRLEQQGSTEVEGQKAWRLQGRFDWQLPGDPLKVDSGFEVLLLRGEQGQTWRLVRPPSAAAPQWRSYPLVNGA